MSKYRTLPYRGQKKSEKISTIIGKVVSKWYEYFECFVPLISIYLSILSMSSYTHIHIYAYTSLANNKIKQNNEDVREFVHQLKP